MMDGRLILSGTNDMFFVPDRQFRPALRHCDSSDRLIQVGPELTWLKWIDI